MYIPKREGEKNIFNIQTQKETVEKDIFHTEIFNFIPQIHVEQERKPSAHKYKKIPFKYVFVKNTNI